MECEDGEWQDEPQGWMVGCLVDVIEMLHIDADRTTSQSLPEEQGTESQELRRGAEGEQG